MFFFFFFQAEDGIRDLYVTGVQTCALPISCPRPASTHRPPWRWPDWACARGAASERHDIARTTIVVRMVTPFDGFCIPISYPAGRHQLRRQATSRVLKDAMSPS